VIEVTESQPRGFFPPSKGEVVNLNKYFDLMFSYPLLFLIAYGIELMAKKDLCIIVVLLLAITA
jgi:hypothetical protein